MPSSRLCVALALLSCASALGSLLKTKGTIVDPFRDADSSFRKLMASAALGEIMPAGDTIRSNAVSTDTNGPCGWDVAARRCYVSTEGMRGVLEGSSVKFSQLVGQLMLCRTTEDEHACNAAASCFWSKRYGSCEFVLDSKGYEDTSVVKRAPISVMYYTYSSLCPLLDAQSCLRKAQCSWDSEQEVCIVEEYVVLFGATAQEIAAAVSSISVQVWRKFSSEFDTSSPEFDAKSLLDWKIPETACPTGTRQAACDFAKVMAASLIPVNYYCHYEHDGIDASTECLNDPLCEFDSSASECKRRRIQVTVSAGEALEALSRSTKHPGDKKLIALLGKCFKIASEHTCTEDCRWGGDSKTGHCRGRFASLINILSDQGGGDCGPLCHFFSTLKALGCDDATESEECEEKPGCEWREQTGCSAHFMSMTTSAFVFDPVASESLDELNTHCTSQTSSDACVAAGPSDKSVY